MCYEPELILENYYGNHQPCVFCENYLTALIEQGFEHDAKVVMDADHAVDVLYNGPDSEALEGCDLADLTERATWAWENILDNFRPADGWHLGYMPDDEALWAIPDGWENRN